MGERKAPDQTRYQICRWLPGLIAASGSFVLGLALSRLLYEGLFPAWSWIGRPLAGLIISLSMAVAGWLGWARLARYLSQTRSPITADPDDGGSSSLDFSKCRWHIGAALPFLALFLNLLYLFKPGVSLIESRFLLFTSLWLFLLILVRLTSRKGKWTWLGVLFSLVLVLPIYLLTMGRSVGQADTFEFQVIVPQLGIAHPTGYPLYILLSKPFTWLPFNSVAWRVNLATVLFGLAAVCMLYLLLYRLIRRPVISVLAVSLFGLTPTFWSQSIEAEVYSLNVLFVVASLFIMREIGDWKFYVPETADGGPAGANKGLLFTILLAFWLGLGLTNHLTTIILMPGAIMTFFFAYKDGRLDSSRWSLAKILFLSLVAFLLPLLLYAYLPIRWSAVNQEPMGLQRFVDWVIGGRFQGALQLTAWLKDSLRYEILLRLFQAEWPWLWFFPFALIGLVWSYIRNWKFASIILISWLGYVYYGLNYYVPDLGVFLLPAFVIMSMWWALGLGGIAAVVLSWMNKPVGLDSSSNSQLPRGIGLLTMLLIILLAPFLAAVSETNWNQVDASDPDGRVHWGRAVLEQPLAEGATILADSDKFPPLYYLQQVDGLRADLDILLLPDESSYRAELDLGLAEGKTVYLARFLPGLEGIYQLSSMGPLTEVAQNVSKSIPSAASRSDLSFGSIKLLGYQMDLPSPFNPQEASVTLYWQTSEPLDEVQQIYLGWSGPGGGSQPGGQHPVDNYYPTIAWQPGEIISDFHSLPPPLVDEGDELSLQVAFGPPFSNVEDLPWKTVTSFTAGPPPDKEGLSAHRIQLGPIDLDGVLFSSSTRPGDELEIWLSGRGPDGENLAISLDPHSGTSDGSPGLIPTFESIAVKNSHDDRFLQIGSLPTDIPEGTYEVVIRHPSELSRCGWLAKLSSGCSLGTVEISGASLPAGAFNFDDKIAMLSVDIPEPKLGPGQILDVQLRWRALGAIDKDYTLFLQVLNEEDKIVGQVDSWPVQGTYPTSSWIVGEIVDDEFQVQLDPLLAPGAYRLLIGWYLLEDLGRLPLLNEDGQQIDDKLEVPGLFIPQE